MMEFYINFGVPGVLIGFAALGFALMRLDYRIMLALAAADSRGLLLRAMPGLALLQPGGNLLEILVAFVGAHAAARIIIYTGVLEMPLRVRLVQVRAPAAFPALRRNLRGVEQVTVGHTVPPWDCVEA